MQYINFDLTPTFIIICISLGIVVILRFAEGYAIRSAISRTKRILKDHQKSN